MKKWLMFGLTVVLAGCSSSQTDRAASDAGQVSAASPEAIASMPGRSGGLARIAAAPDGGELLTYAGQGEVRHLGSTTWRPVVMNERHALAASHPAGELSLTAPDGRALRFVYEHQRYDADDRWTWIGRLQGGEPNQRAIVNFNGNRVSGSIDQPNAAPLQLATFDGRVWLGRSEAAPMTVAAAAAASEIETDYLMPPVDRPLDSQAGGAADQSAVIDLVVGYTPSYANAFSGPGAGGIPRAEGELFNIVATVNNALFVSNINARVRIVHRMMVDYPDTTPNFQALRELTGADGIAVNPVFAQLRQARDTYGGDLVLLVRKHDMQPSRACGASWLIGGALKGIDSSDSGLGYLVWNWVAPGSLPVEHCHEFASPHTFGHALGLQHDRASASPRGVLEYGAYPYAFGYISGPAHRPTRTAMAYPFVLTAENSYIYSTPEITCHPSAPCVVGIAGEADNVRAARQTTPIVGSFRARKVRGGAVPGDYAASGQADLFWRNPDTQEFAYWLHGYTTRSVGYYMDRAYDVAGIADFTGDGRSDVLWKNDRDHYLVLWVAKDLGYEQREIGGYEPGMSFVGVGDFSGDERYDLMWRSYTTGQIKVWTMQGHQIVAQSLAPMPAWYEILGIGDYTGDGHADLIYADSSNVNMYVNVGVGFTGHRVTARPTGWTLLASSDLNNDQRDDLIWQNSARTTLSYWTMDGTTILSNPSMDTYPYERFVAARNTEGNPSAELIWNQPASNPGGTSYLRTVRVDGIPPGPGAGYNYPSGWQPR